ncbi:MAG: TIGR03668 family PPOX class F420-dependent oxidoreductase [Solirubrobacterales bacterium]
MDPEEARGLLASARVASLATCDADGQPHLVPITFALDRDVILTAVDHKPKRTTNLRRLRNIAANPRVAVLADHYEDDWSRLWWVRADGTATVVEPETPEHVDAVARLAERYEQYRQRPPDGPAIAITVSRWSGWRATPPA